jgi:hypothetical protein
LELNRDITWPEIHAALATSATGKAPGMDGITNEVYKLCKEDTPRLEPTTPMGRMLLEAVNSIFHGDIPEDMHSSLIISIPKPHKDATLLDNHRGISLIDCLLKLTTRVISDRLHTHLIEGPRGLRKEQAGFRRLQECPAQAATLYEIALRRRQVNQVTFAAFIDLRKAFDMVPHRCLLHVLSSRGINGACLNFISTLYSHAGFKCSAGNLTSTGTFPLHRGVKQGDTLSPVLFDLFIDSALDGIRGVTVPNLRDPHADEDPRIPGLLFADDTVILAESEAELQDSLNTFGDWCDRFGMEVGHAKCGVMALGVGDSTQLPRPTIGPFTIQRGTIPIVDKYTYLGIVVTPRLDVRDIILDRRDKGLTTLRAMRPMLATPSIPLKSKLLAIKGQLIPQLAYGGELFGSSGRTAMQPLQRVLSKALNMAVRGKATHTIASATLSTELELPTLPAIAAGRAARAWRKWPDLGTWIGTLFSLPARRGKHTLVQRTKAFMTRLQNRHGFSPLDKTPKQLAKQVQFMTWERHLAADRSHSSGYNAYVEANYSSTNNYLSYSNAEGYSRGFHWLARARTGGIWNAARGSRARLLPPSYRTWCASCESHTEDSLEHLLLQCPAYAVIRDQVLGDWIAKAITAHQETGVDPWQWLLGSARGEHPEFAPAASSEHVTQPPVPLCIATAHFLGISMPTHMGKLWGSEEVVSLMEARDRAREEATSPDNMGHRESSGAHGLSLEDHGGSQPQASAPLESHAEAPTTPRADAPWVRQFSRSTSSEVYETLLRDPTPRRSVEHVDCGI